jgi:hypothetical protein
MQNVAQLQKQVDEMKAKLAELEETFKNQSSMPIPQQDQTYWIVTGSNKIYRDCWDNQAAAKEYYNIGNVFLSKEEAEQYARKDTAHRLLQRYADVVNGGRYEFAYNKTNCCLLLNEKEVVTSCGNFIYAQLQGVVWFPSEANAMKAYNCLSKQQQEDLWS